MAMLAYDDRPLAAPPRKEPAPVRPTVPAAADDEITADAGAPAAAESTAAADDEVFQRWLAAQPWPRRWFARFYRALRKLQPAFPPLSCC